jgi:hypothetical protein
MCAADDVVSRHLELRERVRALGAVRSTNLPECTPGPKQRRSSSTKRSSQGTERVAVVVAAGRGEDASGTLAALESQTSRAAAVAIVRPILDLDSSNQADNGVFQVASDRTDRASMINLGVAALEAAGVRPLAWMFLAARDLLSPSCLERCENVLRHCDEVGLVSSWVRLEGRRRPTVEALPCPSFPYQWIGNQASDASAVRAEAWEAAGGMRPPLSDGFEMWDLSNAVLAAGWKGVTVPEILCARRAGELSNGSVETAGPETMRRLLLERFPVLVAEDAQRLVLMTGSQPARKVRDAVKILSEYLDAAKLGSAARASNGGWSWRARRTALAPLLAMISWALRQASR